MAAPRSGFRLKSVADLQIWLQRDIGSRLSDETELIAHGGTALTLLGLKEASKDVDFGFRTKADFDRLVALLRRIGYRATMDLRPSPGELLLRLYSRRKFKEVGLPIVLGALVKRLRDSDRIVDWDDIIGVDGDALRKRLMLHTR